MATAALHRPHEWTIAKIPRRIQKIRVYITGMLIELVEGFWVDPERVAVVKATGKKKCALFLEGQSAIDGGFTLDFPAEEVAVHINDGIDDYLDEDESEEEESDAL